MKTKLLNNQTMAMITQKLNHLKLPLNELLEKLKENSKHKIPDLSYKTKGFIQKTLQKAQLQNQTSSKEISDLEQKVQDLNEMEQLWQLLGQFGEALKSTIQMNLQEIYRDSQKLNQNLQG